MNGANTTINNFHTVSYNQFHSQDLDQPVVLFSSTFQWYRMLRLLPRTEISRNLLLGILSMAICEYGFHGFNHLDTHKNPRKVIYYEKIRYKVFDSIHFQKSDEIKKINFVFECLTRANNFSTLFCILIIFSKPRYPCFCILRGQLGPVKYIVIYRTYEH